MSFYCTICGEVKGLEDAQKQLKVLTIERDAWKVREKWMANENAKLRAISDDSTLSWQQKHIESWTILHPRSEAGDE
jgi:hypothetical protein